MSSFIGTGLSFEHVCHAWSDSLKTSLALLESTENALADYIVAKQALEQRLQTMTPPAMQEFAKQENFEIEVPMSVGVLSMSSSSKLIFLFENM